MICCYWCSNYKGYPFSHCKLNGKYIGLEDKPFCGRFVPDSDDFNMLEMMRFSGSLEE